MTGDTRVTALVAGARFFAALPLQLLRPIPEQAARAQALERLRLRDERFLDRIRHDIYAHPDGVYYKLLRHAGCEYGDMEAAVRGQGLEAALTQLFRAGVWISVDEFKGRKPIVRGTLTVEAGPDCLRSPRAAYHLPGSSGGSRSGGTPVLFDLRFVRDCACNLSNFLSAHGGLNWAKADWESPGGGARFRLIKLASFGKPPLAWFSQMDPRDPLLPATALWSTRAMRLGGWLAGRPLPAPVHTPLSDPGPAVDWAASIVRSGRTPLVFTFPSSAVRLCVAAKNSGADIAGTRFLVAGEPITSACVATIRSAGCTVLPRYGSMETGAIGYGCGNPEYSDDLHLLEDMHALIQAGESGSEVELPEDALLITSLHKHSPFLMLNVSMGDQASLVERECGCTVARVGWRRHIHTIRSFEKLTTLGVTFLGSEVIPVLEHVLPARLGGSPTSYQLVESEGADGQPRLELRAHPDIGPVDEGTIFGEFCSAVERISSSSAERIRLWRDAGTLSVVKKPPEVSRVGKILHIHRMKANTGAGSGERTAQ